MIASAACGPSPRTAPPASPTRASGVPVQVGRYRLTAQEPIKGFATDTAYHFSDGSATRVTVFLYPIPQDVQIGPDSQAWTAREGMKFEEVQSLLLQRGAIGAYQVAFADTGEITAGNRKITEHSTAVVVRARGRVAVEFQYLYLVNGRFLKVRATVPSEGWERTDVPVFAREVARQLATAHDVHQ